MKKLLTFLGILLALVLVIVLVAAFALGSLVRSGVNNLGPQVTQTPVRLDDAELSAFSGRGTLRGLTVGNPEGWSGEQAFRLQEVHFDLEPRTLLGGPIVINELTIQRPEFFLEQKLTGGSNLRDLIENIRRTLGPRQEQTIGETEEPPRKFIIHKLRLENGAVQVGVAGATALDVPLPELSYDNLGVQEGGLTAQQLANVVLTDVLGRAITTAAQSGILSQGGSALEAIGDAIKQSGGSLQRLLGGAKDAAQEKQPKKD